MKFNNRNLQIGSGVIIGKNVKIGDDVTIYDNVAIGDDSVIANHRIIGEPPASYYSEVVFSNPPLRIGAGALIRSHGIKFAGSDSREDFQTGHRVTK